MGVLVLWSGAIVAWPVRGRSQLLRPQRRPALARRADRFVSDAAFHFCRLALLLRGSFPRFSKAAISARALLGSWAASRLFETTIFSLTRTALRRVLDNFINRIIFTWSCPLEGVVARRCDGGAGCGACGFRLASGNSGTPRGTVRSNYVGLPSMAGLGRARKVKAFR